MKTLYCLTTSDRFRIWFLRDMVEYMQEPPTIHHSKNHIVFPKGGVEVIIITGVEKLRGMGEDKDAYYYCDNEAFGGRYHIKKELELYMRYRVSATPVANLEDFVLRTSEPPYVVFWNIISGDRKNRKLLLSLSPTGTCDSPWVNLPDETNMSQFVPAINKALYPRIGKLDMHWELFSYIHLPELPYRSLVARHFSGMTLPGMVQVPIHAMESEFMSNDYLYALTRSRND